ncbi:MAG: hypothetical protein Kow0063_42080 [Anaerolineae bacterium]
MTFIQTIPEAEAEGQLRELYQSRLEKRGYVPNYLKALSLRPGVYQAWADLEMSIRKNMRLRRYELVTIFAAASLKCSY